MCKLQAWNSYYKWKCLTVFYLSNIQQNKINETFL